MRNICDVENCEELEPTYCHTAKHYVCKKHHDLFHKANGDPLENPLSLNWKPNTEKRYEDE